MMVQHYKDIENISFKNLVLQILTICPNDITSLLKTKSDKIL